jgi:hypothetical protein
MGIRDEPKDSHLSLDSPSAASQTRIVLPPGPSITHLRARSAVESYPMPTCRAYILCLLVLSALVVPRTCAADPLTGEQIYKKQCARCHGADGEGSKKYPHALVGDRTVPQLAKLISETMPESAPGTCTGPDADRVAKYIFDSFYSPAARARNKAVRIELARLTVGQYRNAVADLVGSFRTGGALDERRGLRGEYFKSRRFRNDERQLDRIDPEVSFDFGTTSPVPGKLEDHTFSIRWEGCVLAPDTGEYEFVVRTEHAMRLWVNDVKTALIDALVKSGSDTEYRASIFLLGGRAYPLRLEFSKAKQGVDDSAKNKNPPPVKASMALLWKPPQRALEVIPQRNLAPARPAETFVVTTAFPPDDRSVGWERGTTVSKAWDQATTDAALETASYVTGRLTELGGAKDKDKVRDFCRRFVERAFRRPLTDEQKRLYVDHQFEATNDLEAAVKRVVVLTLKSPRFLYREVGGGPDGYDVASRLSFALWDSLPDKELLDAAAAGKLSERDQVMKQAERLLADRRASTRTRAFLLRWLKLDQPPDMAKDPRRFPGFDTAIVSDLRTSLELSLEDVIKSDKADFRQLLLSEDLYLNGRLAKFYGVNLPADAPFQKVALDPGERAGVLTHPYLMAAFSYTGSTSPIHRGVFVARGVLGLSLRPPPEAFTPLAENLHPNLTTRERVELQTRPAACVSCHGVINPLGFTLERFDAVGRFRDKENGKPVDATGTYKTRAGQTVKLAGVRELAKFLADSDEVHGAFAEQLFHHLVQQPVRAYGPQKLGELRQTFASSGFNIRKLTVEIATTAALTGRAAGSPQAPAPGK